MTVPVQSTFTASIANGATTVFPYGFKIAAAEDLAVTIDGVRLTSGYTVSGVGNPAGGNVTITAAPANGAKVVRYLAPILERDTDYQQFGDWLAAVVNLDFDRIWLTLQTLQQNDIRSLKLPVDTIVDQVLSQDATARANRTIKFDGAGNLTISLYDPDGAQSSASASVTAAATHASNAAASASASEAAYDSFDDRYLGAKASAPTLDNDGNALLIGALYWDTTLVVMRTWSGAAWASLPTTLASAVVNTPAGGISAANVQGALNELDAEKVSSILFASTISTVFNKASFSAPAFLKTGAGTISVLAGTSAMVAGTLVSFAVDTAVTMPSLTLGTDYAIYFCTDGTVRADANFSAPTGYTTANSRKIGGFHYAPGGNAAAQAGGDSTPAINARSIWDLKWRPTAPDPRGLFLVPGKAIWAFIYFLGVDHITNGPSRFGVTIADGSSPAKRPLDFGGDGTAAYAGGNWFDMAEALASHGHRPPTKSEYSAMAYGVTEATSRGTDPGTTGLDAARTSRGGMMQAAGNLYIWGDEFGGGAAGAAWTANTGGRGSTYQMENAVRLGGAWTTAADSGSRCSVWDNSPAGSDGTVGARGVCDHYQED